MPARPHLAPAVLRYGIAIVILAAFVATAIAIIWRPHSQLNRVPIGLHDEVYYLHAATPADASALGEALRRTGFLNDRGTTVLVSKGTAGTSVSFVLNDEGWLHPATVYSFEEIGRRVASSIGGFPIQVRLIDSHRVLHKELTVGKLVDGARDAVYYFGSATSADARALANALRGVGYFSGQGASVVVSKDDATAIAFVVEEGVWDNPAAIEAFTRLARSAAPAVGGLPVQLRLLDAHMEPKRAALVQ